MIVGKCWVEMVPGPIVSLAHGAPESRLRPVTDPGLRVGSYVGGKDRAEWRRDRNASGEALAARRGMTGVAIAERCKLRTATHERGVQAVRIGRGNRVNGRVPRPS